MFECFVERDQMHQLWIQYPRRWKGIMHSLGQVGSPNHRRFLPERWRGAVSRHDEGFLTYWLILVYNSSPYQCCLTNGNL